MTERKRLGILRGGENDYFSSIKEGANILLHISEHLSHKYKIVDILVDRDGVWHIKGLPVLPSDVMHRVDVVWNTASPKLSSVLKSFSIPVVSVSPFVHSVGQNRKFLEQHIKDLDIAMPRYIVFPVYQKDFDGPEKEYARTKTQEVFRKFAGPWIVRSFAPEPSMGVHVAKTLPELERGIEDALMHKTSILVEELISGRLAPVHSILGFRGEEIYTFPLENIFSSSEKERLEDLSKKLHRHLGDHVYLKSNFLVTPKGKIYLTGVLFNPNIEKSSHFHKSAESVGAKMHHIVEHILERVL